MGPTATKSSRRDPSPRGIWFTCAKMCTTHVSIQSFLNYGLHDWSHLHIAKPTGYKFRGLRAGMRLNVCRGFGFCVAPSSLCLCAVYVLQGCPSALCLVWRRGLLWQANHDQLGSPAHKEFKSRRLQPVCICRLLTSHLIALTHQLLLLRAGVIYLYTNFPQDEGRTNWARCVYLCVVCVCLFVLDGLGKLECMVRMPCTTNIWWDIP